MGFTYLIPLSTRFPHFLLDISAGINYLKHMEGRQPPKQPEGMTTMTNVEAIVKHSAVSRVYANGPRIELLTDNLALQALCRLRRMRRDSKRAIQNAREDVAVAGWTDSAASMPRRERELVQLRIAHTNAALLPADLAAMVAAEVE